MSSVENFDGLCGIIARFASSDLQLRCKYEFGHGGVCSFEKYKRYFIMQLGFSKEDYDKYLLNKEDNEGIKRGFIESVLNEMDILDK